MRSLLVSAALFCLAASSALAQPTTLDTIRHYDVQPLGSYSAIWGYTGPDGREYALLGVNGGTSYPGGTSIIDITENDNIRQVAFINGPNSSWREMKTYRHYGYIVSEGGGGVQIVNLSQLPDTAWLVRSFMYSQGPDNITRSHAISIHDGFMYLNGCANWDQGGIVIFDLRSDPENPVYVGQYQPEYIHDSYVLRDTIYGAAIYSGGGLYIADARNKASIQTIGKITYTGSGTHNAWVTKDRRYVITTDEIGSTPKTLKMWNIENLPTIPTAPAATFTPVPGQTVHNVTIRGDYAYVAWYSAGVRVVNIANPAAPADAGGYDTSPTTSGYNGVWGVYPYFPSGKIIAGDMQNGLWVFRFSDLAPRVPVALREPADESVVQPANELSFRWTRTASPEKDPHYYEVHLTGPSLDTVWRADDSVSTFSYTGALQSGATYTWHVVTRDEWNTSASQDTFQFMYGLQTGVPAIVVTAPNGGEIWQHGTQHEIEWLSNMVDTVNISYRLSPDDPWVEIAQGVPATAHTFTWAVPSVPTTEAKVRVVDAQNGAVLDTSTGTFTIAVPLITASADSLDFGEVGTGQTGMDTLRIFNHGTGALDVTSITIDSAAFSVSRTSLSIPAGGSDTISVRFAPTALRPYAATLTLTSNALGGALVVALSGEGVSPVFADEPASPLTFALSQNYPNPFNPATVVSYQLPASGMVTLKVVDMLGREVATLVNEEQPAGTYEVPWNAEGFASGVYFYTLRTGDHTATRKMLLTQ